MPTSRQPRLMRRQASTRRRRLCWLGMEPRSEKNNDEGGAGIKLVCGRKFVAELRLDNTIIDDRYLVDRCLGRGSYAECFLSFDGRNGDEPVIIKALNTSLQGTPDVELERTLVENFQNEA